MTRETAGGGRYGGDVVRSAWIKWARAVEHQRLLARRTREFVEVDSYEYVRTDNARDQTDPLVRMHWRLHVKQPYPEQWSVVVGDVLTNLRAALDHVLWSAVVAHSGPPAKPQRVQFPITSTAAKFQQPTTELESLVAPKVWEVVEAVQPFHAGAQAHTTPLEVLRWLCNVDKHRTVHVVGRTAFDIAPVLVEASVPLTVVEEWRHEGAVQDGAVVARLKMKRPAEGVPVDLRPTFAHLPSLQISDTPPEHRSLATVMDGMREDVLWVLTAVTAAMGEPTPAGETLDLGDEHETFAAEYGGHLALLRHDDGTIQPIRKP